MSVCSISNSSWGSISESMEPFLILCSSGMEWAGRRENCSSARLWYVVESLWTPEVARCCCASFSSTKPLQGRQGLIQILEPWVLALSKWCGFVFLWSQHQNWHTSFVDQLNGICRSQKGGQCVQDLHAFPGCYASFACVSCIFFLFF